jgi:hypothetical protein
VSLLKLSQYWFYDEITTGIISTKDGKFGTVGQPEM